MDGELNQLKYTDIHNDVVRSIVETGPNYYIALITAFAFTLICFFFPWFYQLYYGIGAAGMNHPGVWGTYLASFIFWIGLSHSGTLLSCVLHITNSSWRKAMYRSAEAMTLFFTGRRRHHGDGPRGQALVHSLGRPLSQPDGNVAQLPLTAVIRRHGHHDVPYG